MAEAIELGLFVGKGAACRILPEHEALAPLREQERLPARTGGPLARRYFGGAIRAFTCLTRRLGKIAAASITTIVINEIQCGT